MGTELLFEQSTNAIILASVCSLVPLGACLLIGVCLSVVQAATQIQDQTLTFVPKLLGAGLIFWFAGPFIANQFGEFLTKLFLVLGQSGGLSN